MSFSKFCTIIEPVKKPEVLLIDFSNLAMRCLFSLPFDPLDENFNRWKILMMGSLKKTLIKFNPDKVIFCLEGHNNWRKLVYTDYKANRVYGPPTDANHIDFDIFFGEMQRFIESFSTFLTNAQFLSVDRCEADDLIGVIVKSHPEWNITCQSSDRDFYQLYKYSNYKQYDGIKKKIIEVLDPKMYLLEKVITGDAGDNVPKLKTGIGQKRAAAIINSSDGLDEWLKKENLEKEFERNMKLISFDCIPEEISFNINKAVNDWNSIPFDPKKTMNFLIENKLTAMFDDFEVFINIFQKIK